MNFQKYFFSNFFIMQNWRPLKIGGPRRLPSLPNGRTGPGYVQVGNNLVKRL